MNIRKKLTLQYAALMAFLFVVFTLFIYFFSSAYRQNEFYRTLHQRALTTAYMYLEEDELPEEVMQRVRQRFFQALPTEWLKMYDMQDQPAFIPDTSGIELTPQKIQQIRELEYVNFKLDDNRQAVGIFYRDNQGDFVIIAAAHDIYGLDMLQNLRVVLFSGLFIMLVLVLLVGNYFSGQALKPIAELNREAEDISAENLHKRLKLDNEKDEIGQLAKTFNLMLERLDAAFNMQRSFIANASHGLRTPLTAMTGDIEVALMKDRTIEEYKELLIQLLEDTVHLTGISNSLLELAQASYNNTQLKKEILPVKELVENIILDIKRGKPGTDINLNFKAGENSLIWGSTKLLTIALNNLLENALKFSENLVTMKVDTNENMLIISIIDTGIGISKADMEHVFEPFYRASNASSISGHGIGLPLAEKIIQLHGGSISIESVEDKGTTVNILLPLNNNNSYSP